MNIKLTTYQKNLKLVCIDSSFNLLHSCKDHWYSKFYYTVSIMMFLHQVPLHALQHVSAMRHSTNMPTLQSLMLNKLSSLVATWQSYLQLHSLVGRAKRFRQWLGHRDLHLLVQFPWTLRYRIICQAEDYAQSLLVSNQDQKSLQKLLTFSHHTLTKPLSIYWSPANGFKALATVRCEDAIYTRPIFPL